LAKPGTPEDPKARFVAAQVRLASGYLQDSRTLAKAGSRSAVNLLFQAAEAALIAVMTSEGQHAGRGTQHQLGAMKDTLPDTNDLKPLFAGVEHLTGYATTFRYAAPSGRVRAPPSLDELEQWQDDVNEIIRRCVDCFGIDLTTGATSVAIRTQPPRVPDEPSAPKPP
jgi:hypothetical protein